MCARTSTRAVLLSPAAATAALGEGMGGDPPRPSFSYPPTHTLHPGSIGCLRLRVCFATPVLRVRVVHEGQLIREHDVDEVTEGFGGVGLARLLAEGIVAG